MAFCGSCLVVPGIAYPAAKRISGVALDSGVS
jgi:hypothetical protein